MVCGLASCMILLIHLEGLEDASLSEALGLPIWGIHIFSSRGRPRRVSVTLERGQEIHRSIWRYHLGSDMNLSIVYSIRKC